MKTVWKFYIEPNSVAGDVHRIEVPAREGAIPLTVLVQWGQICLWFEVDTDKPPGKMNLYCVGTGHGRVPDRSVATYLCSVVHDQHVWHFYRDIT